MKNKPSKLKCPNKWRSVPVCDEENDRVINLGILVETGLKLNVKMVSPPALKVLFLLFFIAASYFIQDIWVAIS